MGQGIMREYFIISKPIKEFINRDDESDEVDVLKVTISDEDIEENRENDDETEIDIVNYLLQEWENEIQQKGKETLILTEGQYRGFCEKIIKTNTFLTGNY